MTRTVADIAQDVRTQDNLATENPIFIVQERYRFYGIDEGYTDEWVWIETDEHTEVTDPDVVERLNDLAENYEDTPGYVKVGVFDDWRFVTACFTRKGCEDFLAIQNHNLRQPTRIWVAGGYRNHEWSTMRKHLKEFGE
jgi:hypothetical protein